jgi:hypothetical protein
VRGRAKLTNIGRRKPPRLSTPDEREGGIRHLHAGLTALRLFRREVQLARHAGQLRQRSRIHLSHDLVAMDFYSDLAAANDCTVIARVSCNRGTPTLRGSGNPVVRYPKIARS